MRTHALLSPSGGHRWMVCTPSARLGEGIHKTSGYADEGTCAHDLFDILLRDAFDMIAPGEYARQLIEVQRSGYYTKGMFDYCYDFVAYVKAKFNSYAAAGKKPTILIEAEIDYSYYVQEGRGYVDVAIYTDDEICVIDFKFGQGVPVGAEENDQLKLYALGIYEKLILTHDIEEIELIIYQPRIDNISEWRLSAASLISWAETVVRPAALLAWKGEGELVPGSHCIFCAVKAQCSALAKENIYQASERFKEPFDAENPALLQDHELADILGKIDQIQSWIKAVKEYALEEAIKGKKWPGFKLVRGRSNRTYIDEEVVLKTLTEKHQFKKEAVTETFLLPITKMESYLGKKIFNKLLKDLTIKPKGAPVLVDYSDKRMELNKQAEAAEVFDDDPENDFG